MHRQYQQQQKKKNQTSVFLNLCHTFYFHHNHSGVDSIRDHFKVTDISTTPLLVTKFLFPNSTRQIFFFFRQCRNEHRRRDNISDAKLEMQRFFSVVLGGDSTMSLSCSISAVGMRINVE